MQRRANRPAPNNPRAKYAENCSRHELERTPKGMQHHQHVMQQVAEQVA